MGTIITKYVGRKFLAFVIGTILFIFLKDFQENHWLTLAGIYLASNVVKRMNEDEIPVDENTPWLTKFIKKYLGRKFLVFAIGTGLLFSRLSVDSWIILVGMYCGSDILTSFIPSFKKTVLSKLEIGKTK